MASKRIRSIAAACSLMMPVLAHAAASAPTVTVAEGKLAGTANADGMRVFKGIPYAAAPVGTLRWRPPSDVKAWTGVRDATKFGAACMQPTGKPGSIYTDNPPAMSEDCLSLNVWTPKNATHAPVMVWIHGGALLGGYSGSTMYDGAKLASKGVVVVSINYRLGIFGFLAHPGLSLESSHSVSGNYGLLDQIAALGWVRRNIAAFGGDSAHVTIAGESAGALSVMDLMASPLARGLFDKAIAQSGYMITNAELKKPVYGLPSAEQVGMAVSAALHAPDVASLRAIDATTLNAAAARGFTPLPTIDGWVLPHQLVETFEKGEQAHVPLLAGFNSGEIRSLRMLAPAVPKDAATYEAAIREKYGDLAGTFLKLYPSDNLEESIVAATRDAIYGWTAQRLVRDQAAVGAPSYLYLFDHGYPAAEAMKLHGFHASELTYTFGHVGDPLPADWPTPPSTPGEHALSDAMLSYWASFVKTGVPHAAGEATWSPFARNGAYMAFRDRPIASTDILPDSYALQEQVVCRRRADGKQNWLMNVGIAAATLPPAVSSCSGIK